LDILHTHTHLVCRLVWWCCCSHTHTDYLEQVNNRCVFQVQYGPAARTRTAYVDVTSFVNTVRSVQRRAHVARMPHAPRRMLQPLRRIAFRTRAPPASSAACAHHHHCLAAHCHRAHASYTPRAVPKILHVLVSHYRLFAHVACWLPAIPTHHHLPHRAAPTYRPALLHAACLQRGALVLFSFLCACCANAVVKRMPRRQRVVCHPFCVL